MEENKYYTPEPEELYIGYTCEACFSSYAGYMIFDLQNPENDKLHEPVDKEAAKHWVSFLLIKEESLYTANNTRNHKTALMLLKDKRLRTKYLDKNDIESFGWKFKEVIAGTFGIHKFSAENKQTQGADFDTWYSLHADFGYKYPRIKIYTEFRGGMVYTESTTCIFNGECKSINELKIIHRLLQIK